MFGPKTTSEKVLLKYILITLVLFAAALLPVLIVHRGQPLSRSHQINPNASDRVEKSLAPLTHHEDCLRLTPQMTLNYSFQTSENVRFDIHRHEGATTFHDIIEKNVKSQKAEFQPRSAAAYCLMWMNPYDRPIDLEYQFEIRKKEPRSAPQE